MTVRQIDTSTEDDVLLTFREAQDFLRVSRATLYRLMWARKLPGYKVGNCWRFYKKDVQACIK